MVRVKRNRRNEPIHPKLRRDVRELTTLLGVILTEQEGEKLYQKVETIRRMTKAFRMRPTRAAASRIGSFVQRMNVNEAHRVVRAFHLYFLLANAADEAHRIRLRAEGAEMPEAGVETPLRLTLGSLKRTTLASKAVRRFLDEANIRPVFTAHPTEATRQTVLQKLSAITHLILEKDRLEHLPADRAKVQDQLRAQVTLLWQTSDLRSHKVTVQDEVLRGLYFFSEVLFDSVSRLCETIQQVLGMSDPRARLIVPPVSLGSWMGGDRDGHPFVTPQVTRETLELHRQVVLERYGRVVESLYPVLSSSERVARVSLALKRWVRRELRSVRLPSAHMRTDPSETYRWALRVIHAKLKLARERKGGGYHTSSEFQRDVERLDAGLREGGAASAADQYVRPLLWAIRAFGFSLVSLDIRQNASHIRSCVTSLIERRKPGLRFAARPEEEKRAILLRLICGRARVHTRSGRVDLNTSHILEEFRTIAWARKMYEQSAVGSFILSNTEEVSDILSVLLLAKEVGLITVRNGAVASSRLDVVPLFETITDLRRSPQTLRSLLAIPLYRSQLRKRNNRQEIMIGYSDSSKDGGIVSAAFELYKAQISMHAVARSCGVLPVFFHGRGGSISRGGGPVYESILAQPRETMTGEIKITEQGEMISAKYLISDTSLYNLEVMAAAVLYCMGSPLRRKDLVARDLYVQEFQAISRAARETYLSLTRHPHFWEFYYAVTPLDIIEQIEIGSRPASRTPRSSLDTLRAIPWVFSWTQCRLAITGWYGFGFGVESAVRSGNVSWADLERMYRDWFFFRALVDNIEMVLAKTDLIVGEQYLGLGSRTPSSQNFTSRIREEYQRTRQSILRIKRQDELLEGDDALRQSLQLRNPYLDPIHFIQIRFLQEFRGQSRRSASVSRVLDLLRSSINGIASGMKNTG